MDAARAEAKTLIRLWSCNQLPTRSGAWPDRLTETPSQGDDERNGLTGGCRCAAKLNPRTLERLCVSTLFPDQVPRRLNKRLGQLLHPLPVLGNRHLVFLSRQAIEATKGAVLCVTGRDFQAARE